MNRPKIIHLIALDRENYFPRGMYSWNTQHNNRRYVVWDHEKVKSYDWERLELIEKLLEHKQYELVEQYIRYQILFDFGGMIVPHDSINLLCTDPLFIEGKEERLYADDVFRLISAQKQNKLVGEFSKKVWLTLIRVPFMKQYKELEEAFWKDKRNEIDVELYLTQDRQNPNPFVQYINKSEDSYKSLSK